MTKSYKRRYRFFLLTSLIINILPLTYYITKAITESNLIYQKISLTMTVFAVLIMTAISIVNKITLRSRLWIILIGLYICLSEILEPLIIIAACQIMDELLIVPLKKHYKDKLLISKEIDKRYETV